MSDNENKIEKEKIQDFIRNKVQEEVKERTERLRKENRELKAELEKLKKNDLEKEEVIDSDGNGKMSRRSFLKKASLGAAGLGLLSLNPVASKLKITKNGITTTDGTLFNQNLNLDNKNVENVANIAAETLSVNKRFDLPTKGTKQSEGEKTDHQLWVDKSEEDYRRLKVKVGGEIKTLKETYVGSTPQTAIAQYDWRQEDGTLPIKDLTDSGNDLDKGSYSGVSETINGKQAANFDGDDDYLGLTGKTYQQPIVVYFVCRIDSVKTTGLFAATNNNDEFELAIRNGDEYFARSGSDLRGNTASTGVKLHTVVFDGSNSVHRVNGTQINSGNAGTDPISDGWVVGNNSIWQIQENNFSNPLDGAIGFVEVHDSRPADGVETREQQIADDWGINI